MSNIKSWYKAITNNDIHAQNKVSSSGLALSINFIQLPDTDTVLITVAVIKNKLKKASLGKSSFGNIMHLFEKQISLVGESYDGPTEPEHFERMDKVVGNCWYITLCCHRVFFIPVDSLWETLKEMFSQKIIELIKKEGVEEISVFVNTKNWDFNAKFY